MNCRLQNIESGPCYSFCQSLCLCVLAAVASPVLVYQCDEGALTIKMSDATVFMESAKISREFGPLTRDNSILYYGETRPGSDDERIVTAEWFRFDETTGELVYLRNQPDDEIFIHSGCVKDGPS